MIAKAVPLRRPLQLSTLVERVGRAFRTGAAALARRRRLALDRRLLAEMNDQALADLGIGRDQARWFTDDGAARGGPGHR